ncbi:MAG: TrmJ/YjtD family RNA methyltransferase [Desulfatitalea sp.]|nr:TrmJ/YjtD family RNA methyltransferase [Desulfatitalea sp.]NNK00733.1 TrmJ/YjtD family RNA methyltransferase [Desulfatitalea sp.]
MTVTTDSQVSGVHLDNVAVVLNRPRYPENIGAAARAACNMGIRRLVVVAPEKCDLKRVLTLATHAAADVVEQMHYHENLREALAPYGYIIGTTARLGGQRQRVLWPEQIAQQLIPISRHNQVALLFGPEDRGLTNEELRLCHQLVTIPTDRFSSLNLAQAVVVLCYELHKAGRRIPQPAKPRLATRIELDGMYDQIRDILVRINYIQPENPEYWMNRLRDFGTRLEFQAGEVSILRGICRQINWYAGKCHHDGVHGNPPPQSHAERDT